jgi:8-oxo-dGTP pyrophosphatase MutT (NUDIX family)
LAVGKHVRSVLLKLRERLLAADASVARYADAGAVVAILVRNRAGPEVLVMERAKRDSDPWSGHWSFPGGRRNPGEPLLDAVRRETEEEVGLSTAGKELLGCLEARPPANRPELLVVPFVFAWDGVEEPRPGPEVASVAWVPLMELPRTRTTMNVMIRERERPMPAFVRHPWAIWGFTYRLLEDFLRIAF